MGKRLSRIVTRTGDDGKTGLADGSRVAKHSLRMETIGTVDELNSTIGVFLADLGNEGDVSQTFRAIQNDLFDIGGELSMPGHIIVPKDAWQRLETTIEQLNDDLEPLANFILPGGSRAVALCHVVRAVARRAERCYVALCDEQAQAEGDSLVNDNARIYLNRLSDLCFVAARWLAKARGEPEILWQQNTKK